MENDAREEENVVWGDPGSLCCLVLLGFFLLSLKDRGRETKGLEGKRGTRAALGDDFRLYGSLKNERG